MRPLTLNGKIYFPKHAHIDKLGKGTLIKTKFNGPLLTVDHKDEEGWTICLTKTGTQRLSPGYPVIELI